MTDLPSLWQQQLMCSWWEITACLFRLCHSQLQYLVESPPPPRPILGKHQSSEKADCCAASQSNKRTSVALDAEGPEMPETLEVAGIEVSLWNFSLVFYRLKRQQVIQMIPNKHCTTIISVLHASFNVIVPSTTRSSKRSLSFRVPPTHRASAPMVATRSDHLILFDCISFGMSAGRVISPIKTRITANHHSLSYYR